MRHLIALATLSLAAGSVSAAGDPAAGAEKAAVCAACHGPDGTGLPAQPKTPVLAGQHANYLEHSLKEYKSGDRKDPIMQGQAANLSEQDIRDLAAYYAQQKGLYTPEYSAQ